MNYIEHYDEELDLAFEIPELDMSGYATLEDFFEGEAALVNAALLSALYNAIEMELDQVPVFAVKESDSVVSISRDQYEEKIESCIGYFTLIEEYEFCTVLTKLKAKL